MPDVVSYGWPTFVITFLYITVEPSLMEALTVITAENPTAPCVFTASISKLDTNSITITVIVNPFL